MAKAAEARKASGNGIAARMDAKLLTGRFFMERMLPETGTLLARVAAGSDTMMALPAEAF
jgi:acyl-CoA dehydrogenase